VPRLARITLPMLVTLGLVFGFPSEAQAHSAWVTDTTGSVLGGIDHFIGTHDGEYHVHLVVNGGVCGVAQLTSPSISGTWKRIGTTCAFFGTTTEDFFFLAPGADQIVFFRVCIQNRPETCGQIVGFEDR
jgi:hypothetical protein